MRSTKTFEFTVNSGEVANDRALTDLVHAPIDLLTSRCIVRRPACVTDIDARWDSTVEPGRVLVEARGAIAPAQRSTATGRQHIADAQRKRWAAIRNRACHG